MTNKQKAYAEIRKIFDDAREHLPEDSLTSVLVYNAYYNIVEKYNLLRKQEVMVPYSLTWGVLIELLSCMTLTEKAAGALLFDLEALRYMIEEAAHDASH